MLGGITVFICVVCSLGVVWWLWFEWFCCYVRALVVLMVA